MAYYSSDEDFDEFLSDNSDDDYPGRPDFNADPQEPITLTLEQKLNNLYFSIINGCLAEVILAINEGIDVNAELRDGWTSLLLAASFGNAEIALELIDRGANFDLARDKYTPFMAVCACTDSASPASKRLQIINALIERGVNTEAITRKRQTAFMYAASSGNVEVLERLIPECNIHAEDNQAWTALHWAVYSNKPEAVQLLINTGLSCDKIDIRGHTPIHYAVKHNFEDVVQILSKQEDDDETVYNIIPDFYDIEEIFKDLSPQFFRDIRGLLYGMKCENLANYFSNMDLLEFLSLDDNGLEELGIELPYQRHRILKGLHKFHGHTYKQKSIPIIPKDEIYSTIDIGSALVAAIRQLIAMEASIKYISHINTDENVKPMEISMRITRTSLQTIRKTAKALHMLTSKWDSQIQPVDLIRKVDTQRKPRRWFKYLGCISIITVTVLIFTRTRL